MKRSLKTIIGLALVMNLLGSVVLTGCTAQEAAQAVSALESVTEIVEEANENAANADGEAAEVNEDGFTANEQALLDALTKEAETRIANAGKPVQYETSITESSQKRKDYPAVYDLRAVDTDGDGKTENYVTSVKNQNPFGTCWSFAAISAAETSILFELGQEAVTTDEDGNPCDSIDLSEHHLSWFAYTPIPEGDTQAGEGLYSQVEGATENNAVIMNSGSNQYAASQIFASGMGPKGEPDYDEATGVDAQLSYHGINRLEENGVNSNKDDWSVDESLRYKQTYMMENSHYLPKPVAFDDDGNYDIDYAETIAKAYKEELMNGHPVTIAYCADNYRPGKVKRAAEYINTAPGTWAHYCYEPSRANHAVTIIGWDDTYSKENFLTEIQEKDEKGELLFNEDGTPKMKAVEQPPKDGAWIVKNSWGAVDSIGEGLNIANWGYDGTGYFYLSYYDQSIETAQCFDFDVNNELKADLGEYVIDEYDMMPSEVPHSVETDFHVALANVYTAEYDEEIKAVSCVTTRTNEVVLFEIYKIIDGTKPVSMDNMELVSEHAKEFEASGIHIVRLPKTVVVDKGEKYAVLTIQKANGSCLFSVGSEYNEKGYEAGYTDDAYAARGVVNPGESYIYLSDDEKWWDFAEVKKILEESDGATSYLTYDNFPIKAYASILK